MRRSVATFWWMPEEEAAFLDHVCKRHEVVAFTAPWKKRREDVVPLDFRFAAKTEAGSALTFGRADLLRGNIVEAHNFPNSGTLYNVRSEKSNLLWFRGGQFADGKLALRTIGAYWDHFDVMTGATAPKSPEFEKWGRSLLRWIHERTPEKEGYYRCSHLVKQAHASGNVELVSY